MDNATDYFLQGILTISDDTLKDTFFQLGGKISELPYLKNCMITVDIDRGCDQSITE